MMIFSKNLRGTMAALLLSALSYPLADVQAAPDITGPWQVQSPGQLLKTIEGDLPPLLPAALTAYQTNMAAKKANAEVDPVAACLPPGVPRLMTQPWPFNIVQGRRTIAMMFEWNHLTRLIYMNREHFKTIGPIYLGQSIGHWESDTLVVDTNSFNDETWLDDSGLPHSTALHTMERIRLLRGGSQLEDLITFEDPKTFTKPWTARLIFVKKKDVLIKEDYCLGRTGKGTMSAK
ncbi:MAG: hypothetical protein QM808_14465 [Steroidobacteraceae bacterium]